MKEFSTMSWREQVHLEELLNKLTKIYNILLLFLATEVGSSYIFDGEVGNVKMVYSGMCIN